MKCTIIEKHLCTPALPIGMTTGGDKRKMKTQIVAILAIIAVITALITVSAVSNEVGYNVTPCDAIDISIENTTVTREKTHGWFNGSLQTGCWMYMSMWQQGI